MKPATTKAAVKRQPTCQLCKKRFRTSSKTAKFCNASCRTSFNNKARHVRQISNASTSPFFYELARQAIRARTIQIYHHFDQQQLETLYDVYASYQRMNGYGLRKEHGEAPFELSHIAPVRGEASIGLFRADNLVIAPMALNRSHGARHYSGGASISRIDLLARFAVSKDAKVSEVVHRVIKTIGEDVVQAVVQSRKIKPSQRQALYSWLVEHLDPANPDHTEHLNAIETASARILAGIKRQLEGKEPMGDFRVRLGYDDDTSVLMKEWERIGKAYRPELLPALERIQFLFANTNSRFSYNFAFDAIDLRLVFDMLHGQPAHTVTSIIDAQYAKALASPTIYQPTEALVSVAEKPLRVSMSVTESFLEGLDDCTPYIAPDALYGGSVSVDRELIPAPF
ncbi:hypothetical protein P3C24_26500 [Pseudomonas proteolytica]|uniref:hypothetical protein n=1 Tax=Pseudomonas proteolytica TaxID=219574 RepID=UPI0023DFA440|nr:hypothetical protein [Pseudomonas proteolytica]MDF3164489.1 hypothetical protein [Pseudomonas proteolytica]